MTLRSLGLPPSVEEALRRRPELLFVPFATIWLAVNVAPWGFGPGYLVSFYQAFTFQKTNSIFPFTYAFAIASFGAALVAGLRWARLPAWRAFLIGGTLPFAGPAAFEIVFQESGKFVHPGLFVGYALPYVMVSYGTWVLLGLTGLGWWRVTRAWGGAVLFSVVGFLVWIAGGMPLVAPSGPPVLSAAFLLNVSLKASFFLVFLLPVIQGMQAEYQENPASGRPERAAPRGRAPEGLVPGR